MAARNDRARAEARRLRTEGHSINAIARMLGVSLSSVSLWVRGIDLTAEQRAKLKTDARRSAARKWSATHRARREAAQERGRAQAREGDPLHLAGCMLYWGEGSKGQNQVDLANSDPALLRLFLRFLRECYDVPLERIRLTVHCFLNNGLELEEIEQWWLDQLDLPPAVLRKAIVNTPSRASKGRRPSLTYGTVRISVSSTELQHNILGAIQEYGQFEKPEWLETYWLRRQAA